MLDVELFKICIIVLIEYIVLIYIYILFLLNSNNFLFSLLINLLF